MIVVIDNYDSFTYNLVHYIEMAGVRTKVIRNDVVGTEEIFALMPSGVVISPGPCTPREAGISSELVALAPMDMPVLGVCLGCQSIATAFGGKIGPAKSIMHGKTSRIKHFGGRLYRDIPELFEAVRYHSLAVERDGLPGCLRVDAETSDGEIMGLSHNLRPVYGVQFHPESIGSDYGRELIGAFLEVTGDLAVAAK